MKMKKHFIHFWRTFFYVRVFLFIFIGTSIIFLTFLTNDNAVEIAISGIASVFIGIGVNNFSSYEMQLKDEQKRRTRKEQYIKLTTLVYRKIGKIQEEAKTQNVPLIENECSELEALIGLGIQMLFDD